MIKETLDKHGLKTFNDTVNERLKNRVKYKGELELVDTMTDWSSIAPTHIGDTYLLTGDEPLTIGDVTYHAGEWVIAMNETRLASDGSVVDEAGAAAEVKVEKLGSAGLPDGENDGDVLVYVNGEWITTDKYGYDTDTALDTTYSVMFQQSNSTQIFVYIPEMELTNGANYTMYVDGTEIGTCLCEPAPWEPHKLRLHYGAYDQTWFGPSDDFETGVSGTISATTGTYDCSVPHDVRFVTDVPTHVLKRIDKKYIETHAIKEMLGQYLPYVGEDGVFYVRKKKEKDHVENWERYKVKDEMWAQHYGMNKEMGLLLAVPGQPTKVVYDWPTIQAEWDEIAPKYFVQDNAGDIGHYTQWGDGSGDGAVLTVPLYDDGTVYMPKSYYQVWFFKFEEQETSTTYCWHKIYDGAPDGGLIRIGESWMKDNLEMID